jgi:hypothetical protein
VSDLVDADDPFRDGPACFRNKFDNRYKTFQRGDFAVPVNEWVFVHRGPCQCEGQSPPDCIEPGDDS